VKAAVLGSPISHSRSPVLHRAAYAALNLPWSYDAIDVPSGSLQAFKAGLDSSWRGLSLTMPLKEEVLDLLDECSDLALRTRSANTVVIDNGRWLGSNTDIFGMVRSLTQLGATGTSGAVIGSGATARSAIAALVELGVDSISIWARRQPAAQAIGELVETFDLPWQISGEPPLTADIVISTVPAGAIAARGGPGYLLDAIYHPWPPPLTAAWAPDRVATGLDLLLWQAVGQVEAMTGSPAPVAAMRDALFADVGFPQPSSVPLE